MGIELVSRLEIVYRDTACSGSTAAAGGPLCWRRPVGVTPFNQRQDLHPVPRYRLTVLGDGAGAALIYLFKEPVMSFAVPDACTLPTVDRPLRLAEFEDFFASAVRRV